MCVRARSGCREDCVCVCVCVSQREREREKDGEGERSQRTSSLVPWPMEEKEISELQGLGVRGYGTTGFVISKTPIFLEHSAHPYLRLSKGA